MKLSYLLAQFPDVMLIKSAGHTLVDTGWIIKHHPGVDLSMLMAIYINPVILQKRLGKHILKRVEQIVAEAMDNAVVFLKIFEFAKMRKLGNHHIVIVKSDLENAISRYHRADILNIADGFRSIIAFPGTSQYITIIHFLTTGSTKIIHRGHRVPFMTLLTPSFSFKTLKLINNPNL